MFAQVLFIDTQHIRRGGGIGFHVVVELEPVDVAKIARLAHAQDNGFQESVEPPEQVLRRYLGKIPGSDGTLCRLEQGVLAYTLFAPHHQRMFDLVSRVLLTVGKPPHDMVAVVGKYLMDMIKPSASLCWISRLDRRRAVEIETSHIAT